jgi:DNA modification methylase
MYLAHMVQIFQEVRRVLRDDGTLWLNLGDSYSTQAGQGFIPGGGGQGNRMMLDLMPNICQPNRSKQMGLKPKDLCGIPWRVALALQADGWFLRSDIIWSKPNPMPESVTDRPTKAHEYIFLLTKSARYFYDANAVREITGREMTQEEYESNTGTGTIWGSDDLSDYSRSKKQTISKPHPNGRNMRSVWRIPTQPYAGAHFATFPEEIPYKCIAAGTSERGVCPQCAAPRARVTDTTRTFERGSGRAGNLPIGKNGAGLQGGGETLDVRRGPVVHTQTTGWRPTCACQSPVGTPALQPALVLDPFGGSGTVGEVALKMGRRFVLLDLAYQDLQRDRIGMFACL